MNTATQTVARINHLADLYLRKAGGFVAVRVRKKSTSLDMEMAHSNVYEGQKRMILSTHLRIVKQLCEPISKDGHIIGT